MSVARCVADNWTIDTILIALQSGVDISLVLTFFL